MSGMAKRYSSVRMKTKMKRFVQEEKTQLVTVLCVQEEESVSEPEPGLNNALLILVIAIVVGCFAVLWPKTFSPMLFGDGSSQTKSTEEG